MSPAVSAVAGKGAIGAHRSKPGRIYLLGQGVVGFFEIGGNIGELLAFAKCFRYIFKRLPTPMIGGDVKPS